MVQRKVSSIRQNLKRTKGNTVTPTIATKTMPVSVKERENDPKKSHQSRKKIDFNNAENMTAAQQLELETTEANKVPIPLHYTRRTMLASMLIESFILPSLLIFLWP